VLLPRRRQRLLLRPELRCLRRALLRPPLAPLARQLRHGRVVRPALCRRLLFEVPLVLLVRCLQRGRGAAAQLARLGLGLLQRRRVRCRRLLRRPRVLPVLLL
jgi:hypothetical protein